MNSRKSIVEKSISIISVISVIHYSPSFESEVWALWRGECAQKQKRKTDKKIIQIIQCLIKIYFYFIKHFCYSHKAILCFSLCRSVSALCCPRKLSSTISTHLIFYTVSYSAKTAGVSILDAWGSCSWAERDCWSCQFRKQGSTSSPNSEARHSVSAMRRLGFALKMCISV